MNKIKFAKEIIKEIESRPPINTDGCVTGEAFERWLLEEGRMTMEKLYAITVREILEKTVCVRANSLEEATDKTEKAYRNVEILIEPECIVDTEFVPSPYAGYEEDGVVDEDDMEYYKNNYQWIGED